MTLLIGAVTNWYCPNCGAKDQTQEARPHQRFHTCPKLSMLTAPMVREGVSAKVELREREDYLNGEIQQTAAMPSMQFGPVRVRNRPKPVMSIVTTRDGGQDVRAFAPLAKGRGDIG